MHRAPALLLLALIAVFLLSACSQPRRLTEDERDRRNEETLERIND